MWFTLFASLAFAAPDILRFDSGMRIVHEHRPGTPWMATSMTFSGAGEAAVEPGREHLAHLVEHLWYRVANHEAVLHAMGCEVQAFTWSLTMDFLTTCPADVIEQQLDLERAKLGGAFPGLDEATVALERDVVALETGAYREVDAAIVARAIAAQMERDSAVGSRLAARGVGEGLDLAAVQGFVKGHLRPERAVLAIVSPIPTDELRPLLEARFGEVVSTLDGPLSVDDDAARPVLRLDVRTVEAPLELGLVVATWELPGRLAPTAVGLVGWLEDALARQLGADDRFLAVVCAPNAAVSTPSVSCWLGLAPGVDPVVAARVLLRQLDVRDTLSKSLLDDAWDHGLVAGRLRTLANVDALEPEPDNRPSRLAHVVLQTDAVLPQTLPERLSRRERRAIRKLALEAFDPQRALVIAVVPTEERPPELPAARPVANTPVPVAPAPKVLATPPALAIRSVPGGLAIARNDLAVTQVVTLDASGAVDVDPWLGQEPTPLLRGMARVYVGPHPPAEGKDSGEVVLEDLSETPEVEGRGLVGIPWSCGPASVPATLLVTRELLQWRLMHVMRMSTAWSYSPLVSAVGGSLALDLEVLPDAEDAAKRALAATVAELAEGRLVKGELAMARRRARLRGTAGVALPSHWSALVTGSGRLRTPEELRALPDEVRAVDVAAVAAFFADCAPEAR